MRRRSRRAASRIAGRGGVVLLVLLVSGVAACRLLGRRPRPPGGGCVWGWTDVAGTFHPLAPGARDRVFRLETSQAAEPAAGEAGLVAVHLTGRFTVVGDPRRVRSVGLRVGGFHGRLAGGARVTAFAPHLTPAPHLVMADASFRAPVVLEARGDRIHALIPDLHALARARPVPWALRYRPAQGYVELLAVHTRRDTHVFYAVDSEKRLGLAPGAALTLAAYRLDGRSRTVRTSPHGVAARFLWRRFRDLRPDPLGAPLHRYVERAYDWAFERWKDVTWQTFELGGRKVGGVVFIVTVHQAPGREGPGPWREKKSIWNQAWFSSLRSALGLARHARRTRNEALAARARLGLEFALAAPQTSGLFPAVYAAGEKGDWAKGEWEWASDRRPPQHGRCCHLTDASWTCDRLLEWYTEIDPDPRIVPYCERYAEALLRTQLPSGAFPAWVDPKTFFVSPFLRESPEGMTSVMFLDALYRVTGRRRYRAAARRCAAFVEREVLPDSRWEDFETYYSCAREGPFKQIGHRDPITGLYPANTLSMGWAAEGFLRLGMKRAARRVLDELSLYQQVWSPPFLYVPASGGFGVQNTDAEWNDARQSLFCRIFFEAADAFGDPIYRERARLALKASFIMMYCPENPAVRRQYELRWKELTENDFGFMMENYAHGGVCKPDGTGIGEFTIWDWGPGAAAEAFEWAVDHGYVGARE